MTAQLRGSVAPAIKATGQAQEKSCSLGSVVDFFCLGGASVILIPAMTYFVPPTDYPRLFLWALILFYISNYPHFAASYQIFYRNFLEKIFGSALKRGLRFRYFFAGIIIPFLLIAFLMTGLMQSDFRMLGYGINLIGLLTGWHYLKQGYGILIVESVLTRRFFNDHEKRLFRYNIYACLWFYWVAYNSYFSRINFFGSHFYTIAVPDFIYYGVSAAALATSLATFWVLIRKALLNQNALPFNGVIAYLATTYIWLLALLNPPIAILIPIFHALQYLRVVRRYENNREKTLQNPWFPVKWRLFAFVVVIIVIGGSNLWILPEAYLEKFVHFDRATYGGAIFLYVFWFFINIHHYFMDNVIWRSENPDTRAYVFNTPLKKPA